MPQSVESNASVAGAAAFELFTGKEMPVDEVKEKFSLRRKEKLL